jgi:hypothetical protein
MYQSLNYTIILLLLLTLRLRKNLYWNYLLKMKQVVVQLNAIDTEGSQFYYEIYKCDRQNMLYKS